MFGRKVPQVFPRGLCFLQARTKTTVLPPPSRHRGSIIFLHGLGDEGRSWEDFGMLIQQEAPGTKVILPDAPNRYVTINQGISPAWYDITSLESRDSMITISPILD
jgi:predicted esterase